MTLEHEILNRLESLRVLIEERCRPAGKPWTLEEAASFLSRSPSGLRKWIGAGRISATTHGNRVMLSDETVRAIARDGLPKLPESAIAPSGKQGD